MKLKLGEYYLLRWRDFVKWENDKRIYKDNNKGEITIGIRHKDYFSVLGSDELVGYEKGEGEVEVIGIIKDFEAYNEITQDIYNKKGEFVSHI